MNILLGDNRIVSARAYANALKMAMQHPDRMFTSSLVSSWIPSTGAEIIEQWRRAVSRRINQYLPPIGKGSKAARRLQKLRDDHATCKWCGQSIATEKIQFCEDSCRRSYYE